MAKKIVVTGANGQLGSEIRKIADHSEGSFVYTDIDTLDLSDSDRALSFLGRTAPDAIINCAAYTAVDNAEKEQSVADKMNRGIPELLARYGKHSGCRIIHISTDYVFGGNVPRPLREDDPTEPESVYGKTKRAGEQALLAYEQASIIRTSWLYSSFGNNFVKSMVRLLKEKSELKVVYDQTGCPTYAADLAEVLLLIAGNSEKKFVPGIYHYSNEGITSWYDLVCEIREMTGSKCKIFPIETKDYPLPAPRPAYAVLNKEKIREQFSLSIPHWKTSLKRCMEIINS